TVDTSTGIQSAVGLVASGFADLASGMLFMPDYETAWGAGDDAGTNNWAMVIPLGDIGPYLLRVDNLQVPSTSTGGVTTNIVLVEDQEYILRASGMYTYNTAGDWADAEWYLKSGVIVKGDTEGSKPYVLDVSIDGYAENIDWGTYNPEHKYEYVLTGTGVAVKFFIYDSNNTDNNGEITVEIYVKTW
ncbi:MAG: hypothetical protein R6W99_02565, partial [Clostridia bacterium]